MLVLLFILTFITISSIFIYLFSEGNFFPSKKDKNNSSGETIPSQQGFSNLEGPYSTLLVKPPPVEAFAFESQIYPGKMFLTYRYNEERWPLIQSLLVSSQSSGVENTLLNDPVGGFPTEGTIINNITWNNINNNDLYPKSIDGTEFIGISRGDFDSVIYNEEAINVPLLTFDPNVTQAPTITNIVISEVLPYTITSVDITYN